METLEGQKVVVTGGSRGIGLAIVRRIAAAGYNVIAVARSESDALRETIGDVVKQGSGGLHFRAFDLSDTDAIPAFVKGLRDEFGAIYGLVNNAAIATGIGGPLFDEIEIDVWDRVMQVNVRGTWLVTRALAPLLVKSGTGRIVNIASDTALWGAPRLLAYVASKGAVMAMTRSLSRELGPRGVGITAVAPGIMRNEATEYVPKERHELYERGRAVPGAQIPEDIAATILFLLTPGALALTGQTLAVDAGFVFT